MRDEYDFRKGKRRALIPSKGKTRITIYVDDTVLDEFRARAEKVGMGYQTMMNEALKTYLASNKQGPVTESVLRRVIREEFPELSPSTQRAGTRTGRRRAA